MKSAEARIYLGDQRGRTESTEHRCFHTFSVDNYQNEKGKPFHSIQAFNDETLKGGSTLTFKVKRQTTILLLPLVGAIEYKFNEVNKSLEAGETHLLFLAEETELVITNPFKDELINFLHVWLTPDEELRQSGVKEFQFDLNENKDRLISLRTRTESPLFHIGRFNGRSEATLPLINPDKGVFVFVIEGAFEMQNRLMQHRDGLTIWNIDQIEFEALSNEAIVLMIE